MARSTRRRATGPQPPPRNPMAAALRHHRPAVVRNKKAYTRKGRSRLSQPDRPFSVLGPNADRIAA